MKRKLLSVLLALTMVLTLLPGTAFAETQITEVKTAGDLAKILANDDNNYTDTAQVDGDTVTLQKGVTISKYIKITSGNITLNLGEYNIERTGEGSTVFTVDGGNTSLTLKGSGKITSGKGPGVVFQVTGGAKLNLDGVTVTAHTENSGVMVNVKDSGSTLQVSGGKFETTVGQVLQATNSATITFDGTEIVAGTSELQIIGVDTGASLELTNTTVNANNSKYAIFAGMTADNPTTLTIDGNSKISITKKDGMAVVVGQKSSLIMNGGTITAPAKALQLQQESTAELKGGKIERTDVQDDAHGEPAVIVISKAKLNMTNGEIIGKEIGLQVQDDGSSATVTGGTIESQDASGAAAVAVTNGSTFKMTAGTIKSACQGLSVGDTADSGQVNPASATIGGTAVIDCQEKDRIGEVQVGDSGSLTIEDGATINGSVAVFNQGTLNVKGGTITSKNGFAIGTNGSQSKGAKINITGGTITGSDEACGVYLPAGTMTVEGDNTVIKGGAGIVQFGGELTVSGGKIEATNEGQITVGDSNQAVPASAVTTNLQGGGYGDSVKATLKDGEFIAPEGQASVVYTDKGRDKSKEASPKLTVTGGSYSQSLSGTTLLDSSLKAERQSTDPDAPFSYYTDKTAAENAAQQGDVVTTTAASANKFDVTLHANGGSVNQPTYNVPSGAEIVLPTPSRPGDWRFDGWLVGGDIYPAGYKYTVTGAVTLTALWTSTYIPPMPTYSVSTPVTVNGSVRVSPANALYGSRVTVTVTPNAGYQLESLTVTAANGAAVNVTANPNGTYTFIMPGSAVTVNATFSPVKTQPSVPTVYFADVAASAWYYDAVAYAVQNGLMDGVTSYTFNPEGTTTRAMLVTILWRLENEPYAAAGTFTDVPAGQWYSQAVAWAAANHIVDGYDASTFGPGNAITREQMAAILYRYAAYKGYSVSTSADLSGYTDAGSVSSYALTAMRWANAMDLVGGVTATTLAPQGTASRAQIATVLMRFCEQILK